MLRAMNSAVVYPITGQISDVWHKIHLLVQINLAALEFPPDKNASMIKRQLAIEKNIIFDRLNRLVRCLIDCKVYDGDGIGVRAGLDLARAIAANAWEAHPAQLQQVPGLGPVTMRKFLSHGIKTIEDLTAQSFVNIERLAGRNPPFGKNMLKSLQDFPQLKMSAEIFHRNGRAYTRSEDSVNVAVKVLLGYNNAKIPNWNGKLPVITFLAETTDGRLANFWRGNIKKLSEASGFELDFIVSLSAPNENISCFLSCEEIVGTQVILLLSPDVPSSAFQGLSQRRAVSKEKRQELEVTIEDINEGDLADEDMLDALEAANLKEPPPSTEGLRAAGQYDECDDDFPDIEDVVEDLSGHQNEGNENPSAPVRMDNGKWMCNHHCAGGAPTKNGKQCTHKCCHEGLDKPRPAQTKKKSTEPSHEGASTRKPPAVFDNSTTSTQQPGTVNKSQQQLSSAPASRSRQSVHPGTHRAPSKYAGKESDEIRGKRQLSESSATVNRDKDTRPTKKPRTQPQSDESETECIDLCDITDDEIEQQRGPPNKARGSVEDLKKLSHLQNGAQSRDLGHSRIEKPGQSMWTSNTTSDAPQGYGYHPNFDSGSDMFGDEYDGFPLLEDLERSIREKRVGDTAQNILGNDKILGPSVLDTHRESNDSG